METCKRKEIRIGRWVIPAGLAVAILLIIGSYFFGYYSYSSAKKPVNEVMAKSAAVVAEKQNYTITELVPMRLYLIKSIDGRIRTDETDELAQGLHELVKKFRVLPINSTAINKYIETGSKTVSLIVYTEP